METQVELTDEHREFLKDLRDSGVTNMFGACPYLMDEFGLKRHEARRMADELFSESKDHFECLNTHFAIEAFDVEVDKPKE